MNVYQLFVRHFDRLENKISNAITEEVLFSCVDDDETSAHSKISSHIENNIKTDYHYLGWDDKIYPQYFIKKFEVN